MKMNAFYLFCYALLLFLGGVVGFVKAGSLPSLIMGSLSGGIALLSGGLLLTKKVRVGYYTALTLSLLLTCFFGYRFALSMKWMPAGLMSLISLSVGLLLLLSSPFEGKKQR